LSIATPITIVAEYILIKDDIQENGIDIILICALKVKQRALQHPPQLRIQEKQAPPRMPQRVRRSKRKTNVKIGAFGKIINASSYSVVK